jgi:hypothetical protein
METQSNRAGRRVTRQDARVTVSSQGREISAHGPAHLLDDAAQGSRNYS